jgi:cell division protein ZapA
MSSEPNALDIVIMGREFRVSCREEEREELMEAVALLEQRMREVKDGGKVAGAERVAMIAALNIAHELLTMRVGNGFDLGDVRRRIGAMQATVDRALTEQDELF